MRRSPLLLAAAALCLPLLTAPAAQAAPAGKVTDKNLPTLAEVRALKLGGTVQQFTTERSSFSSPSGAKMRPCSTATELSRLQAPRGAGRAASWMNGPDVSNPATWLALDEDPAAATRILMRRMTISMVEVDQFRTASTAKKSLMVPRGARCLVLDMDGMSLTMRLVKPPAGGQQRIGATMTGALEVPELGTVPVAARMSSYRRGARVTTVMTMRYTRTAVPVAMHRKTVKLALRKSR